MPYAEFNPQGSPGEASTSLLQGLNVGQSWMERSQAMKIQGQEASDAEKLAAQNRDHYEILHPVVIAQGRAQQAEAANQLAGAVQMNDLTTIAQTQMPVLRSDWAKTYEITDPKTRLDLQEQLLGNADRFASLKGSADEIKQWHEVWAQGQLSQRGKDQITGRNDVAAAHVDALTQMLAMKQLHDQEMAKIKLEATQAQIDQKAAHDQELAKVKAEATAGLQENKIKTSTANKTNQVGIDSLSDAQKSLAQIDTAIALLDDPDVRTGAGGAFELKAKQIGAALGVDTSGVRKTEQLQAILGTQLLEKARQLHGSISDKDITFLGSQSPSLGKTPEGNKLILQAYKKGLEQTVQVGQMISDARNEGKSEIQIANEVSDFKAHHSIFSGTSLAEAASKPPTVSTQEQFDALPSGAEFLTPSGKPRRKP